MLGASLARGNMVFSTPTEVPPRPRQVCPVPDDDEEALWSYFEKPCRSPICDTSPNLADHLPRRPSTSMLRPQDTSRKLSCGSDASPMDSPAFRRPPSTNKLDNDFEGISPDMLRLHRPDSRSVVTTLEEETTTCENEAFVQTEQTAPSSLTISAPRLRRRSPDLPTFHSGFSASAPPQRPRPQRGAALVEYGADAERIAAKLTEKGFSLQPPGEARKTFPALIPSKLHAEIYNTAEDAGSASPAAQRAQLAFAKKLDEEMRRNPPAAVQRGRPGDRVAYHLTTEALHIHELGIGNAGETGVVDLHEHDAPGNLGRPPASSEPRSARRPTTSHNAFY